MIADHEMTEDDTPNITSSPEFSPSEGYSVDRFTHVKFWCEVCQRECDECCALHGRPTLVPDSIVPPRAFLTAPAPLTIKPLTVLPGEHPVHGVFAKRPIQPNTQFGPYEAKITETWSHNRKDRLKVKIFDSEDTCSYYLDCADESVGNWMIFVRPASEYEEQNVSASQYLGNIYYTVIKPIARNTELRVWYSKPYAIKLGEKVFDESPGTNTLNNKLTNQDEDNSTGDKSLVENGLSKEEIKSDVIGESENSRTAVISCEPCAVKDEVVTTDYTTPVLYNDLQNDQEDFSELQDSHTEKLGKGGGRHTKNKKKVKPSKICKKKQKRGEAKVSVVRRIKLCQQILHCDSCDQTFPSRKKLEIHSYEHTGEMRFKCEIPDCNKGFNAKSKLIRHQLIHNDNRAFPCEFCGKCFLRKDHLKTHMKVHGVNNEKHHCDQCAKEYTCAFSFKVHMGLHAAERGETQCVLCQEDLGTAHALQHHIRLHSRARTTTRNVEQKPHGCAVCSMHFYTMLEVRRHMLVHTKEKHFLCQFCPHQFGRKDHLMKHMKSHHRSELPGEALKRAAAKKRGVAVGVDTKPEVSVPDVHVPPAAPLTNNDLTSVPAAASFQPESMFAAEALTSLQGGGHPPATGFTAMPPAPNYSEQVMRAPDVLHSLQAYAAPQNPAGLGYAAVGDTLDACGGQMNYQVVWQAPTCTWPQVDPNKVIPKPS